VGNSKVVGGIIVGVAIIAIIAAYSLNQEQPGVSNEIPSQTIPDSSVAISDSVVLTKNNSDYEIDEDGNKKYTISAGDAPIVPP